MSTPAEHIARAEQLIADLEADRGRQGRFNRELDMKLAGLHIGIANVHAQVRIANTQQDLAELIIAIGADMRTEEPNDGPTDEERDTPWPPNPKR